MIKKILLPTDGSENALRAARMAGELAHKFDAKLLVIYVMIPLPAMNKLAESEGEILFWVDSAAGIHGLKQSGREILQRTAKVFEQTGA